MKKINILLATVLVASSLQAQKTLTLADCRQQTLEHNEEIQQAQNAVTEAQLDKDAAFTHYLPKLDGMAGAMYQAPDFEMSGMTLKMHGAYLAGIQLTQPLYAGGKIVTGNRLATLNRECAELKQKQNRQEVIADADNAYWTYVAVLEKIKMVESYKRQMDSLYLMVDQSVKAEMGTEYELTRIDAKRSDINYQLQKAKNGANLCRMNLCQLTGDSMSTTYVMADSTITLTEAGNLDNSIDGRPEFALLQKQVEAKEQQIKMTRADYLPTVGLTANYSYYGNIILEGKAQGADGNYYPFEQEFRDGNFMVMAAASIPLWNWGEGRKKVKKAKLEAEDARLSLQLYSKKMSIETEQAIQNLTASYNMVATAELGMKQAEDNLAIMHNRYNNEMGTLTDLLDAESQWQQAKSNLIEAKTQSKIYETEYKRTTGTLE